MPKGNSSQPTKFQPQSWADQLYKLDRIREAAGSIRDEPGSKASRLTRRRSRMG